jgi:hypothetical protein
MLGARSFQAREILDRHRAIRGGWKCCADALTNLGQREGTAIVIKTRVGHRI